MDHRYFFIGNKLNKTNINDSIIISFYFLFYDDKDRENMNQVVLAS